MQHIHEWFIIVNPVSNYGQGKEKWEKIQALLQGNGFHYEYAFTEKQGHATELATTAIQKGYTQIMSVGGTGTNHEIVNGILNQEYRKSDLITFTCIPIGARNAWARYHNIPLDFKKWIPNIHTSCLGYQDVGLVQYSIGHLAFQRYFINVAGLLFAGYLVKESQGATGGFFNHLLYLKLVLLKFLKYRNKRVKISYNGFKYDDTFFNLNVGICKYTGGQICVLAHANSNDGKLAVSHDKGNLSTLNKFSLLFKLYNGKYIHDASVRYACTDTLTIKPADGEVCHLETDGEYIGKAPAHFSIQKNALKILVPKKVTGCDC